MTIAFILFLINYSESDVNGRNSNTDHALRPMKEISQTVPSSIATKEPIFVNDQTESRKSSSECSEETNEVIIFFIFLSNKV